MPKKKVKIKLDLEEAEELWEYLHHNRPGGHQATHDKIRDAINKAYSGT